MTPKDRKPRPAPQEAKGSVPRPSILTTVYDSLASVTLAIFLLIILALTSIIGTVVLQKGDPQQYLMEYGQGWYRFFTFLGLDDMYSSWWFLTILSLLLINITLCSVKRFPRAWRMMTRTPEVLDDALFKRTRFRGSVKRSVGAGEAAERAAGVLAAHFGKVQEHRDGGSITLRVDKGWYSRLGAYIVHVSILLLAVGAVYGGTQGFKGFVPITEGQTINQVRLRNRDNAAIKLPFSVRCDDFRVEYYPGSRQPKDYYSDLTVLRNGKVESQKRIEVNHPLIIDGIYFYQSSYGIDPASNVTLEVLDPAGNRAGPDVRVQQGATFAVMGDSVPYRLQEIMPDYMEGATALRLSRGGQQTFFLIESNPDFDRERRGQVFLRIKEADIREYTGLQVAWDPGVPIIWLACTVMMIGLYIAFFVAHQRLWIRVDEDPDALAVLMAGTTNRNPASFEREFEKALAELKEALRGGGKGK